MRKSVYDKLAGVTNAIAFRTSYVREFYPSMSVKHMDALLAVFCNNKFPTFAKLFPHPQGGDF